MEQKRISPLDPSATLIPNAPPTFADPLIHPKVSDSLAYNFYVHDYSDCGFIPIK